MKYIKTKEGVYKVVDTIGEFYIVGGEKLQVHNSEVVAMGSTIKELCDCFMVEFPFTDNTPIDFKRFHTAKRINEEIRLKYETNLYGAIWVKGKGLIYVAKMNEEKELVLI